MVSIKVNTISHNTADTAIEMQSVLNLKSLSSDPETSNSAAGDIYFNTTVNKIKVYTGSAWLVV